MSDRSHRVFLVRHGLPDWGATERFRALSPDLVPLTEDGQDRMRTCAERLAAARVARVVSSPATRALQSAHILAGELDVPLVVEPDAREWIPDLTVPGAPGHRGFQSAFTKMFDAGGEWPTGGSETWEPLSALRRRANAVLSAYRGECIAVVTHSVVIYALSGMEVPPGGIVEITCPETVDDRGATPKIVTVETSPRQSALLDAAIQDAVEGRAPDAGMLSLGYDFTDRVDIRCLDHALIRVTRERIEPGLRFSLKQDGGHRAEWVEGSELVVEALDLDGIQAATWMEQRLDTRIPLLDWWPLMQVSVLRSRRDTVCLTLNGILASQHGAMELGTALLRAYQEEQASRGRVLRQEQWVPEKTNRANRPVRLLDEEHVGLLAAQCLRRSARVSDAVVAALACSLHDDRRRPVTVGRADGCDEAVSAIVRAFPETGLDAALGRAAGQSYQASNPDPWYTVVLDDHGDEDASSVPLPTLMAWQDRTRTLRFSLTRSALVGWCPGTNDTDAENLHVRMRRLLLRWARGRV
ncbi:histidine phosphatase family protein [Nocardiopsis sp. NPDC007018]|uniref:histidine phosphatase family protein n=1 Tax=Nocardiopsis sp. NPDC007018 TaxID=3155721 RepID=UPI0033DDC710